VQRYLPHKTPIPISRQLLDCLYRGGYNKPIQELESIFISASLSPIDPRIPFIDTLLTHTLILLQHAGYDAITKDQFVFLDHQKIPSSKLLCRKISSKYYISDLLLLDPSSDVQQRAFLLGFHISLESQDEDDKHLCYITNGFPANKINEVENLMEREHKRQRRGGMLLYGS